MAEHESKYRLARIVAAVSMAVSGALCVLKIAVGWLGGSVAVVADGVESGGDVLASGVLLLSLFWAARPADEDHPYGHGRAESAAGLAVGVMLAITGVLIGFNAVRGFSEERPPPEAYTLWPLLASAILKGGLSASKFVLGRRLKSSALVADASNDLVDVLSAVSAGAAVGLALLDPVRYARADDFGGVIVGVIVTLTGLRVVRDGMLEVMDTRPDEELMARVAALAKSVDGVRLIEKTRGRKSGLSYFFDLHVQVDPAMTVADSHRLAHRVKDLIRLNVPEVADVLVHIEPA